MIRRKGRLIFAALALVCLAACGPSAPGAPGVAPTDSTASTPSASVNAQPANMSAMLEISELPSPPQLTSVNKLSEDLAAAVFSRGTFVGVTDEGKPVIRLDAGLSALEVRSRVEDAGGAINPPRSFRPVRRLIVGGAERVPSIAADGVRTVLTHEPGAFAVVESPDGFAPAELTALAESATVAIVEPDYPLELFGQNATAVNDPRFPEQWGLPVVRAADAWSTGVSTSITVAVIDSGVDATHRDLAGNLVAGWDFFDNDPDPTDKFGHGTRCAGIIGALANNKEGIVGLAWTIRIMPIRIFGNAGEFAETSRGVMAVDYAVQKGARILNLSWGSPRLAVALRNAMTRALSKGVLVVAAAGNGGPDRIGDDNDVTPIYPASLTSDGVISVMALNQADARSTFSNYGAKSVHIAAPGEKILSTVPGHTYGEDLGTSMAAPFVTAAAALLWSRSGNTSMSAASIRTMLLKEARKVPALAKQSTTGAVLNLAFLAAQSKKPLITGSPTAVRPASPKGTTEPDAQWIGRIQFGVPAIGAETTGIVLHTQRGVFELDVDDGRLNSLAERLDGQTVRVRGALKLTPGVALPSRRIIEVSDLRRAPR